MSGRIHVDRIERRAYVTLPPEVRAAIINVKNILKGDPRGAGALALYGNAFGGPNDGPPLPKVSAGCSYREADVGRAHRDDPRGGRGVRRLVFEIDPTGKIRETYYTEEHYEKGSFVRIV
jgi:guanyl-specific ribonuclease Sa